MKKKILAAFLVVGLLLSYAYSVQAATQADLDATRQKKNEAEQKKSEIVAEKATVQDEVKTLSGEISSLQEEINQLQEQLDDLTADIEKKEKEIALKETEIENKNKLLQKRLISMYKNGGTSYIDVLLGSSSYLDMISSFDAVKEITNADTKLMESISDEKTNLETTKTDLEDKKAEVDSIKTEKDEKNEQLKAKKAEKDAKYAELSDAEQRTQEEIDSYNKAISSIEAQIAAAYRQATGGGGSGASGISFDGSFIWPCDCKIVTSRVKWRWGRWHKGVDIGASYAPVYAAASGYVYNLSNPGGYGTYCMMIHGNGYMTLYGHLSSYGVSNGSYVSQGQVIATSGNSGSSTGPHLHFEIRQASNTSSYFSADFLNPLDYLPGGYTIYE